MSVRRSTRLVKINKADNVLDLNRRRKNSSTVVKMAKRVKIETEPAQWQIVYDRIKQYREQVEAPVDTMGCERLAEDGVPDKVSRFQTLISLMLSSQTKDTVTSAAVKTLQTELPGGLTLESILATDEKVLDGYIKSVGFHARKAHYIKETAIILRDKYNGDIPDTIEGLVSLPGVGPKMGYLALQCAWKINAGIGVDVHVHRIANRLGWVNTAKGTPEDTRKQLETWLPKDKWREINPMLVGFGQVTCLPRGPKCSECPVSEFCPSSVVKSTKKTKVETQENGAGDTVQVKAEETIETKLEFTGKRDPVDVKEESLEW